MDKLVVCKNTFMLVFGIAIGSVVYGVEPEFEEVEKVANNLYEFLELIIQERIKIS